MDYSYKIGKFLVTIAQYTAFLNAVAKDDTYSLYTSSMASVLNSAGIARSGEFPDYAYSVMDNGGSSANRPITNLTWFSAARFSNWMANGQPTGAQNAGTTEDGAYSLYGRTSGDTVPKNATNINTGLPPTFFMANENEWYKAAYYSPSLDSGSGGYYLYATQSNTPPGNTVGGDSNQANWFSDSVGFAVTHSTNYVSSQNYLTDVGAFTNSQSYYGTYDQTGNVWEWCDKLSERTFVSARGSGWYSNIPYIQSEFSIILTPDNFLFNLGFRLAGPAA
ncbi:MAG: formylglycine-generating enzyme family protein [Gammaproteobacteria bacterium]|nr:formylglycine-generating enzyme family protein [Gammaproteobacteria bacterium]